MTGVGPNEHVKPVGKPAQARSTALAKPFTDETEQALEEPPPCWTENIAGLHDTPKPGLVATVGVASWQVLAEAKHAEEAPAATTL